ncbi:phage tail-collar fiber domain-containing protein [Metapseudomonas otitidis]|uniref:phage tail-collar fiber domain-containing protein n=1 Tax=Metapseudomonas otitidis TaxID=319939 RepID=UPI0013F63759|nr:phage tail protein [Pseudomonas otitidis]
MAQQDYYTILTSAGLAYEANRKAAGLPIKLTQMSVGDGNGAVYNPDATQTALRREVWRGPINALLQDATNPSYLVGELSLPDDVGGWYVREVGFWTDTGILYAIGKYPESYKPQLASGAGKEFYIRAIFETSNAASVTLVVDDTVVKATRAFVIDYVAAEMAKRDGKNSVRVATTGAIVLSGAQSIDGVAVVAGDRVLVKNQATGSQNGIYLVATGAWTRAADADASLEVTPGMHVPVEEGTANGDSVWQLVTDAPITIGTTALVFEMLAGRTGVSAGTYRSITVDKYGRVTGGTNPTTLAGYGITDALKFGDHGIGAMLVGTDPNLDNYRTGGQKVLTPSAGLIGLPDGWEQGRYTLDITGGTSYCTQILTGASVSKGRTAIRTYDGTNWGAWKELWNAANHPEATEAEALEGTAAGSWISPRRLAAALAAKVVQATEAALGVARIASQALVNGGADDATIVTPKKLRWGFQASITANGYIVFPTWLGSLILQWGLAPAGTSVSVSYPLAFPNELFAVVFGDLNDNPASCETVAVGSAGGGNGTTPTTTAMGLTKYIDGGASSHRVYWFAVGR